MTDIFLDIVNMSITASVLAVIVLLTRLLLKKAPKWISVLLWGLVAIRLICPFAVESLFSLMPKTDWIEQESVAEDDLYLNSAPDSIPAIDFSSLGKDVTVHYYPTDPEIEIHRGVSISFIFSCIWLGGITLLIMHTLISTIRLHRSVGAAIRVKDNIWESSAVDSPFVLGLLSPRIYVPRGMTEDKLAYVIAHEQAHIRRKDHWWKPMGFLLLTLHWFNPLIWLSYILLCRDIEMACDERVVKEYDEVQRANYSEALLECSVKRSMISACPLAFGEVGVKQRIKSVLNYKKPAFWIVTIAVIACIVAAVCFLTNPVEGKADFSVVMEDVSGDNPAVTLDGYLSDVAGAELSFSINGTRCTVVSCPTVSKPEYQLKADVENGMQDIILSLQYGERDAALYIVLKDGTERVYSCDIAEFERLLTWQNSGMPVDLTNYKHHATSEETLNNISMNDAEISMNNSIVNTVMNFVKDHITKMDTGLDGGEYLSVDDNLKTYLSDKEYVVEITVPKNNYNLDISVKDYQDKDAVIYLQLGLKATWNYAEDIDSGYGKLIEVLVDKEDGKIIDVYDRTNSFDVVVRGDTLDLSELSVGISPEIVRTAKQTYLQSQSDAAISNAEATEKDE